MNFKKLSLCLVLIAIFALSACTGPAAALAKAPENAPQAAQLESLPGAGLQENQVPPRQVTVTGNGKVFLAPDVAYINIGVHSQSENVSDALSQNNKQSAEVAKALKDLGVADKDVQTSAFNVFPQQQFDTQGKITGTLYMVDNTVYVTVRDLSKLGKILDTVVRSGANSINNISFDIQDKGKALSQARQLAVEDARRQAEELAKASGTEIGRVNQISVYSSNSPQPMYDYKGVGGAGAQATTPISAGQLVLSIDVTISYELK
jgi:uncharacterized protein YggE